MLVPGTPARLPPLPFQGAKMLKGCRVKGCTWAPPMLAMYSRGTGCCLVTWHGCALTLLTTHA